MKPITVTYAKQKFQIKPLTTFDFIEDLGIPFCVYQVSQGKTVYAQVFQHIKTEAELKMQYDKSKEIMQTVIQAGVVKPRIDAKLLVKADDGLALFLYSAILSLSVPNMKKMYSVKRDSMLSYDAMAKRYGCRPSDLVISGYNMLERLMFDMFVFTIAMENEYSIQKKKNAEIERIRKRAR